MEELLDFLLQPTEPVAQNAASTTLHNQIMQNATNTNHGMCLPIAASSDCCTSSKPLTKSKNGGSNSHLRVVSKRRNWQDWKEQVAEQLSKRSEDPNFIIKKYVKGAVKPKPYDKYTQRFELQ